MRRTFRVTAASVLAAPAALLLAPAAHAAEPDACVVTGSVLTVTSPSGTGTILGQSGGAITLKTGDPHMPVVAGCTDAGFPISVASLTSIVLQDDGNPDAEPSSWALETDTGFGAAVVTIKTEPTDKVYLLSSNAALPHTWSAASTTSFNLDGDGTSEVVLDTVPERTEIQLGSTADTLNLSAWSGRTLVLAGDGADTVTGGSGPDEVYDDAGVVSGNDVINTGTGDDMVLLDGSGADTVTMGTGEDLLRVRNDGAADDVDAGSGADTMYYQNTTPVVWDPATPGGDGAPGENDDLTGFDIVRSDGVGVTAWAPSTGLEMYAIQGANTLIGGVGNEDLYVESNLTSARFSFQRATAGVTVQVVADGGSGSGSDAGFDIFHGAVDGVTGSPQADGFLVSNPESHVAVRPGLGNDFVSASGFTSLVSEATADGADQMQCESTDLSCVWDYSARTAPVSVTVNESDDETGADDGAPGEKDDVPARVQVIGGSGNDTLVGDSEANILFGWLGNDTLIGRGGNDQLQGDAGTDTVIGNSGGDILNGSAGNDLLYGGSGEDSLAGDAGADRLDGGLGDDTERGGSEGDTFAQGTASFDNGSDLLIGGSGMDTVSYLGRSAGVVLSNNGSYGDGNVGEGDNVRADIERLLGTNFVDTITGGLLGDSIFGYSGNDTVRGGSGNDTIDPGNGADKVYGDAGNDRISARDGVKDTLNGGTGTDLARRDTIDVRTSIEGSF
jgi:hypothetical protein